jgi:hypothetical protein
MYDFAQDDYANDMYLTLLALQDERWDVSEIISFDEDEEGRMNHGVE